MPLLIDVRPNGESQGCSDNGFLQCRHGDSSLLGSWFETRVGQRIWLNKPPCFIGFIYWRWRPLGDHISCLRVVALSRDSREFTGGHDLPPFEHGIIYRRLEIRVKLGEVGGELRIMGLHIFLKRRLYELAELLPR